MKPCERDWAWLANKDLKLQMAQNQNRMEIADEELPRGGNPIAALAALIVVLAAAVICVMLVYNFAYVIDGPEVISTRVDRSTILIHEKQGGLNNGKAN